MKKVYEAPDLLLTEVQMNDVIRTSLGNSQVGNLDDEMINFGDIFH